MRGQLYIVSNATHLSDHTLERLDWTKIPAGEFMSASFGVRFTMPMHQQRTLHEYRVSYLDPALKYDSVIVEAYSKRHARKLARRSCRVRQWLGCGLMLSTSC